MTDTELLREMFDHLMCVIHDTNRALYKELVADEYHTMSGEELNEDMFANSPLYTIAGGGLPEITTCSPAVTQGLNDNNTTQRG